MAYTDYSSYRDAWECEHADGIARAIVFREIKAHGHAPAEFVREYGDFAMYRPEEMLQFLGY